MNLGEWEQSQRLHIEVDRLAEEFEIGFRSSKRRPRIEEFLQDRPDIHDELLRELLAIEIELRRLAGEDPSPADYHDRFSGDESIVNSVFQASKELPSTDNLALDTLVDPIVLPVPNLGRYEIRQELGAGGFGTVYLAFDSQLQRFVAIKFPRRQKISDAGQMDAFLAEARSAAKLRHTAIVSVHDVQEHEGLLYIVQEFIEGQNFKEWSSQRQLSAHEIATLILRLADALDYAHQQGITHCDLKTTNVLMDEDGNPHIADFGLAVHEATQASRKGVVFGTPRIMAPEQIRGEGHRLDGRVDIWAMGVMLYELLAGRRPFRATSFDELADEILTLDPRPPRQLNKHVPREMERICLKCLAKAPSQRYNTAGDLRDDLVAFVQSSSDGAVNTLVAMPNRHATASDRRPPDKAAVSRDQLERSETIPLPRPSRVLAPQVLALTALMAAILISGIYLVGRPWWGRSDSPSQNVELAETNGKQTNTNEVLVVGQPGWERERQVAQAILDAGGTLAVADSEFDMRDIGPNDKLPGYDFYVDSIELPGVGNDLLLNLIAGLARVESLDINRASLPLDAYTNAGIQKIGGLRSLKLLHLRNLDIDDSGVSFLPKLAKLTNLVLSDTPITDLTLQRIRDLPLGHLDIRDTLVTDRGIEFLSGMDKTLQVLDIGNTRIGNAALSTISRLTELRELGIDDSQINDSRLDQLATLQKLQRLSYGRNISAAGLATLKRILPNCRLEFR